MCDHCITGLRKTALSYFYCLHDEPNVSNKDFSAVAEQHRLLETWKLLEMIAEREKALSLPKEIEERR